MNGRYRVVSTACALVMAGALVLAMAGAARADEPSRAGLVIVSGPGDVRTACVSFASAEVTGLELLQRAGLAVIQAGTTGVGDSVCKIDAVGCSFPAEHCFCQCLGTPCTFWSYWYWQDGEWVFSQRGAASRRVRDSSVEAWVWGDGQTRPPALDVAAICSPSPRLSAPVSQEGYPGPDDTAQPQPTADPGPYPGPRDGPEEPTPEEPTATPEPEPGPTETEAPPESPTPEEQTATPEPDAMAAETPTPSVTPTRATPTATVIATPATPSPTPGPSATPTDDGMAAAIATAVARNRAVPGQPSGGSRVGGYVAFGLLALVLAGLIVYAVLLRRQRAREAAE